MTSSDFFVNANYVRLMTLAHNLSIALKTLLFRLLAIPAVVTRHVRRLRLKLPRGHNLANHLSPPFTPPRTGASIRTKSAPIRPPYAQRAGQTSSNAPLRVHVNPIFALNQPNIRLALTAPPPSGD